MRGPCLACASCSALRLEPQWQRAQLCSSLQFYCHKNQHLGLASLCRKNRERWRSRLPSPAWRMTRQGWASVSSSPCHVPAWHFHQTPAKQQLWLSPHSPGRKESPLCSQQPSGLHTSLPCLPPGLILLPALQTAQKGSHFWNSPDFAVSIFGNTN